MRAYLLAALGTLALACATRADVKLHPLVSDGMVLQSGMVVPLWGTANPLEKIAWKLADPADKVKDVTGETAADGRGYWKIELPAINKAGGQYILMMTAKNGKTVTVKNITVGEVWLASGQSNMEWTFDLLLKQEAKYKETDSADEIKNSKNPKIRMFTVAKATSYYPRELVTGKWLEASPENTGGFSAVAYYFAKDLQEKLGVPIGIIHSSWGGTVAEAWTSKKKLESVSSLKYLANNNNAGKKTYESAADVYLKQLEAFIPEAKKARAEGAELPPLPLPPGPPNPNVPCVLHDAMITPLQPYAIKGVIWYQGESNAFGRSYEYQTLFPALIEDWREEWKNPDLPFLFVQLAPWRAISKEPTESEWAELCEAQRLTSLRVKNTAMAVINDYGDPGDIHPRKKKPVGQRLALAARAISYGEKVNYTGPVYDKMTIAGNKVTLTFKNTGGGLEAKGGELTGFTVAGKDRKWHNAKAGVKGEDQVVVTCEAVNDPIAVRFGWSNCPVVNLFGKDGLPASAFRTDDFPMITMPKK